MTTHEYLSQVLYSERMVRNKIRDIERYRELATSITVANNPNKVQSSGDKDKMGTFVARMVDLENQLERLDGTRALIIKQIEEIGDADLYQILYSKYVEDINLYRISTIIHCSKTQVYKLYDIAIAEFEKKYGKTYLKKTQKREKKEKVAN